MFISALNDGEKNKDNSSLEKVHKRKNRTKTLKEIVTARISVKLGVANFRKFNF